MGRCLFGIYAKQLSISRRKSDSSGLADQLLVLECNFSGNTPHPYSQNKQRLYLRGIRSANQRNRALRDIVGNFRERHSLEYHFIRACGAQSCTSHEHQRPAASEQDFLGGDIRGKQMELEI